MRYPSVQRGRERKHDTADQAGSRFALPVVAQRAVAQVHTHECSFQSYGAFGQPKTLPRIVSSEYAENPSCQEHQMLRRCSPSKRSSHGRNSNILQAQISRYFCRLHHFARGPAMVTSRAPGAEAKLARPPLSSATNVSQWNPLPFQSICLIFSPWVDNVCNISCFECREHSMPDCITCGVHVGLRSLEVLLGSKVISVC